MTKPEKYILPLDAALDFKPTLPSIKLTFPSGGVLAFNQYPSKNVSLHGPCPTRGEIAEMMVNAGWFGQGLIDCLLVLAEALRATNDPRWVNSAVRAAQERSKNDHE